MNNNSEKRLSRLQKQAVENYRHGTSYQWVACLAASRIVGKYTPGATISLAQDLRVSTVQVQNMAQAGLTYVRLRKYCKELPEYRRMLSHTHFTTMGMAMIKYDIPWWEAIEQLKTAALEGSSVRSMSDALEGEYGDNHVPEWLVRLRMMHKVADKIRLDTEAPEDVVLMVADFEYQAGEWMESNDKG